MQCTMIRSVQYSTIAIHLIQSKQILVEHLALYNGTDKFENKRLILDALF